MTPWLVFVAAGLGTYLSRSLFILIVGDRQLSAPAERALRNIGPAVLAALTASLLTSDGLTSFLTNPAEMAAVVAGVVVGVWRRSFGWTFLAAIVTWAVLSLVA
jgi:branched-subunit amino acid transport protein